MMRYLLVVLLLLALPAAAQPTTAPAGSATTSWPLDAQHTVTFVGLTAHPAAPAPEQAKYVQAWLTSLCGTTWTHLPDKIPTLQLYQGHLSGLHPDVALTFTVQLIRLPAGWQYRLFAFYVNRREATGAWQDSRLDEVLDDPALQAELTHLRRRLAQALPLL